MGSSVFPAAASGPTLAEITTAIQTNGSAFSANWTNIYAGSPGAVSTFTVSGLGSYKYLRVRWNSVGGSVAGHQLQARLNGDAGANYYTHRTYGTQSAYIGSTSTSNIQTEFNFRRVDPDAGDDNGGGFEIFGSNSSAIKVLKDFEHIWFDGGQTLAVASNANLWQSTAAITSITLFVTGGTFTTNSKFFIDGAN